MSDYLKKFHPFVKDKFKISLFFLLIFLAGFSIYALEPKISGDGVSYVDGIEVLKTGVEPLGFTPYRIITTYLGLQSIRVIDVVVNDIALSWLLMNSLFYILAGLFFYSLLQRIFLDSKTAFLGTLFLSTNYAILVFGLSNLMDMGGWFFYIASLYYSYRYLEDKENKWLWIASAIVGIGGLFKEYAFLAYVVILGAVIFTEWKNWKEVVKKIFLTGLLAFVPIIVMNIYSFYVYHYTYLSWYSNQDAYSYQNKIVEYIKSFGSLFNFGWFLFLPGIYILFKRTKEVFHDPRLLFIWLVILSSCVVFVWPVVTRVLFITVPALVLVSSIFIKSIHKSQYLIVGFLVVYTLINYFMDSYVLNFVSLPF